MPAGSKRFVMVIGAMRTGTGWTYGYFRSHDSIYCPALKEWHFFDARHNPDTREKLEKHLARRVAGTARRLAVGRRHETHHKHDWEFVRDGSARLMMGDNLEAYREFFLTMTGDKEVVADITPNYATLDRKAFQEMDALSDDVRFVFIIRNPADRAWSQICKARPKASDRKLAKTFDKSLRQPKVNAKNDYRRTLDELLAVVPPERVHVQLFEEMFTPESAMRLCEFIGVPYREPNFEPNRRQPNNKKRTMKPKLRLNAAEQFREIYEHFEKQYGDRLPHSWREDLKALRSRFARRRRQTQRRNRTAQPSASDARQVGH